MPRLTEATNPRLRRLRSSVMTPRAAIRSSHAESFGSGERSSMTITRPGGRSWSASTEAMQRRVSCSPRYTGTITSTAMPSGHLVGLATEGR
jgi:hypothetical protein